MDNSNVEHDQPIYHYADQQQEKAAKPVHKKMAMVFSLLCAVGIIACMLVDLATSGALTWSMIPSLSTLFGWLVFLPVIYCGIRGIIKSLVVCTLLTLPFMFGLAHLLNNPDIIRISVPIVVIGAFYGWGICLNHKLYNTVLKKKLNWVLAIDLMLTAVVGIVVCGSLSITLGMPILDVWDAIPAGILVGAALVFAFIEFKILLKHAPSFNDTLSEDEKPKPGPLAYLADPPKKKDF